MALQTLGQTDEALPHFEQAARLPGAVAEEALVGRATLLMEAGRRDAARAAFDQALEQFPGSVQALAGRADARTFTAGDPDIAALEACLAEGEASLAARPDLGPFRARQGLPRPPGSGAGLSSPRRGQPAETFDLHL